MVSYKFVQGGPFCFSITQCKIQGQTQMGKCCSSAKKTKQNKRKWTQTGHFLLSLNHLGKRFALLVSLT